VSLSLSEPFAWPSSSPSPSPPDELASYRCDGHQSESDERRRETGRLSADTPWGENYLFVFKRRPSAGHRVVARRFAPCRGAARIDDHPAGRRSPHRCDRRRPLAADSAATTACQLRRDPTTLFAALDVLTGSVIGQCLPRHRHEEFLTFLRRLDGAVPKTLQVHLILDNYHTHKHPNVRAWLAQHPRFHLHFTPTSSSWLNLVERWFRELTDKNLRRVTFPSVPDLIASIEDYLRVHNDNPKPFV
jgi:transposase